MLLTIVAVLIVLSPIIIVHEFGHFIACRLTGIRVEEFAFGFGKILWSKKVGHTLYAVRAIPFGGFVRPSGEMFHPDDAKAPPKSYEFASKKWYAKFFMVVNGAIFNYLLAALLFAILTFVQGVPAATDPVKIPAVVGAVMTDYPAGKAGLQINDQITSANDTAINNWQDLLSFMQTREGDLTLQVKRADAVETIFVKDSDFLADKPKTLGIQVAVPLEKVGVLKSLGYGVYECYYWTKLSLSALGKGLTRKADLDVAGPVGIIHIIHDSVRQGVERFVFLIALLSVAVGMFNLFPIPILDGGYALVYIWEGITGKLPSVKFINIAVNVGFYILMLIVVFATYKDIKRIFLKPKPAAAVTAPQATAKPQQALPEITEVVEVAQ